MLHALGNRLSATPDGGQNWYDRTDVSVDAVAARPPDGVNSGIAVFGHADGSIRKTTDFCQTALAEVKIPGGGAITDMQWDWRDFEKVWAVDDTGKVYLSSNGGDGWGLYNDLRLSTALGGLGLGSLTLWHIGLPSSGGIHVYGGDGAGTPVIAFDATTGGHDWKQRTLGGELLADIPAIDNAYRIIDAVDVGYGLAIALENADAGDSGARPIYYNPTPSDPSAWVRATGLSATFVDAAYIVGGPVNAHQFYAGEQGSRSSWRSNATGIAYTESTNVFPANVSPHHAIWLPSEIHNLNTANVYLIACEDSVAQASGIYKSADALQTVQAIRPVTGFSTWP